MFERVEIGPNAVLYRGDCLEVLPTLGKVDCVITDPPYGIGADEANSKPLGDKNGWRNYGEQTGWDRERRVPEVKAILGLQVPTIIWGGNYYADVLPVSMGWLVWDKGQSDFSLADVELAWWSEWKAARRYLFPRSRAISGGGMHPTQKPLEVMEWCVKKMRPGHTILDPFMGSGTTGVAALRHGCKFIGIEIEPKYFAIAERRIRAEANQRKMF